MVKKILVVADIHGKNEILQEAIDLFSESDHDLLIQLGGLVNTEKPDDLLKNVRTAVDAKKKFKDKYTQILGYSEIQYIHYPDLKKNLEYSRLHSMLSKLFGFYNKRNYFNIAYSIKDRLFSSTGVNNLWYKKYYNVLEYYSMYIGKDISKPENLGEILDAVEKSPDFHILHEIGNCFGGVKGAFGGITSANKKEIMDYNPIPNYFQILGKGSVSEYQEVRKFGENYNDRTGVLFCDLLEHETRFLTLKI